MVVLLLWPSVSTRSNIMLVAQGNIKVVRSIVMTVRSIVTAERRIIMKLHNITMMPLRNTIINVRTNGADA